MKQSILKNKNHRFLAYLFGLAGFSLYASKTITYAFYLNSIIDEGLFLLKGIYFTNGTYTPYQDYGFWMNKMPFGYLFSGWLQKLFGAGLQTGRVAAVFFGLLSLLGMWLLIRRLSGNLWLAGLAVWIFALNNSLIQIYSQWFSEVLVACLMTWVLFFVLGRPRPAWHYLSGGFLLGIIIITRQNLVPLILLLPLYVYWETKQWKPVLFVFSPALFLILLIHILYWPNILQMWLPWLPQSLTPFLDQFRIVLPGTPSYNPYIPIQTRLHAFWEAIRIHFIPIFLSLTALILFTEKKIFKSEIKNHHNFKLFLFLPLAYLFLLAEHFFATILLDYCVYCFTMYSSFFTIFGILSLIAIYPLIRLNTKPSILSVVITVLLSLSLPTGVFYGTWRKLEDFILQIQVPRSIRLDTVDLWVIFYNKYGWTEDFNKIALPTLTGLLIGFVIIGIAGLLTLFLHKRIKEFTFTKVSLITILGLGLIFLPSNIFGGELSPQVCNNVVKTVEEIGAELNGLIPAKSSVYYAGGYSPTAMLYLPDVQIFPQQYEQDYSFYLGGDRDTLEKYGYWNETSINHWLNQSDFVIVSEKNYKTSLGELIHQRTFTRFSTPNPFIPV